MPRERAADAGSQASPRSLTSRLAQGSSWLSAAAGLLLMLTPVYASAGEAVHVVGRGETLYWIARRYHVSVDAIREANNLGPGSGHLRPGVSLTIPQTGRTRSAAARAAGGEPGRKVKGDRAEREGARGKKGRAAAEDRAFRSRSPATGDVQRHRPMRRGSIHLIRGSDDLEVQLVTRHGRLSPKGLAGMRHMLRFGPTGDETAIDPRLAALVGQVSDHFGGKPLHVISGFRPYTPAQYTPHSNHNLGRAMDFRVEGVPNTVVRDFCRTFRNAGVGYYPNSTFVHLDVRTGKAYWVDYSHPGEAPHYNSPADRRNADEAATDVQPHGGAGDGDNDPLKAPPGSAGTP